MLGFGAPLIRERVEPSFFAASPENPSTSLSDPADWLTEWANGGFGERTFGPPVNERTAMAITAVFRCVTMISGLIAGLPLKIYRRQANGGREEATDHRLAPLLQVAPHLDRPMTAFIWRELWGVNVLLWGNHYSIKRYDGAARVVGFEAVYPWDVQVFRQHYRNVYRCVLWDDFVSAAAYEGLQPRVEWIDQDDMIHIPGPGFNGIAGLSRIRAFGRNAASLAALLEEQTGIVHENAARPSGTVAVPRNISEAGFRRMREKFGERYAGRANAGKVIWLEEDSKFEQLQLTPEDLHTIEARRFQVAEICRIFGVPPHLVMETDKTTSWGTGLSEQTLAFLIYTIEQDLGRIEAELNFKLFLGSDCYVEFDRDGLLAMDPVKAAQVAQTEIQSGVMLINERRRHKNRPPVANGDEPLVNSAMVPLAKIFEPGAQPRQDPIQADPLPPKKDVGAPGAGEQTAEGNAP